MGAHFIEMRLDGKLTRAEVEAAIKSQAREDADENGHGGGYSGDWQTVPRIKFESTTLPTRDAASEHVSKVAQKWEFGVAVQYEAVNGHVVTGARDLAKLEKLNANLEAATLARRTEGEAVFKRVTESARPNVVCPHCKAKYARTFIKDRRTVKCLVCDKRLVGAGDEARLSKLDAKVEGANAAKAQHLEACRVKAPKVLMWLIGAWAAS